MAERRGSRGQASVELIAGLPLLLATAFVVLQLLISGYALSLADGAAEAGALALASGRDPRAAVREALPQWAADRTAVDVHGGRVTVRLEPPSINGAIARRLAVTSGAWAREPGAQP